MMLDEWSLFQGAALKDPTILHRERSYIAAMIDAYEDTAHSDLQDIRREDFSKDLLCHIEALCRNNTESGVDLWKSRPLALCRRDGLIYMETARPGRA